MIKLSFAAWRRAVFWAAMAATLPVLTLGGLSVPADVSPVPAATSGPVAATADRAVDDLFDPARHMRVAEVRPGMKGYGLTVFAGSKIEKFDVEVLSVLKNFNPKTDVVLIKFSGHDLSNATAVAGMSGSPIFLDDGSGRFRMIGAFAYGWTMQKDPIAGVQPIEYMLRAAGRRRNRSPRRRRRRASWRRSTAAPPAGQSRSVGAVGFGRRSRGWTTPRRAYPLSGWGRSRTRTRRSAWPAATAAGLVPLATPMADQRAVAPARSREL